MRQLRIRRSSCLVLAGVMQLCLASVAETCITQSQMDPDQRNALASAAQSLALKVQANDLAGVKSSTIHDFGADFSGLASTISAAAPSLAGARPEVEQVYLLDATASKRNPDGTNPDAEFICTLNKGTREADFSINALPPGRYGFAMVRFAATTPWVVSMLMRQDGTGAPWMLAALFPKSLSAAGHDGLWYWSQARAAAAKKQLWTAWVEFAAARALLQPAGFLSSTHLEDLRTEAASATPPEAAEGITADAPLIVKGADGKQYRFTSMVPDDSLHKEQLDIMVHMTIDPSISDPAAMRKLNLDAMNAWLTLHPELRNNFHGMWVFSDAPGRSPFGTEAAMSEIH